MLRGVDPLPEMGPVVCQRGKELGCGLLQVADIPEAELIGVMVEDNEVLTCQNHKNLTGIGTLQQSRASMRLVECNFQAFIAKCPQVERVLPHLRFSVRALASKSSPFKYLATRATLLTRCTVHFSSRPKAHFSLK